MEREDITFSRAKGNTKTKGQGEMGISTSLGISFSYKSISSQFLGINLHTFQKDLNAAYAKCACPILKSILRCNVMYAKC